MAVVESKTELVARFANGNTGWAKVAIEKDASVASARGHIGVWVQNGSGAKVTVNAVEFAGYLSIEQWCDWHKYWHIRTSTDLYYSNTAPAQTTNHYTSWRCAFPMNGKGNLFYMRAVCRGFRIKSGAEWSGYKTAITNSYNAYVGGICEAFPHAPGH